ncbi:MAG: nitroreductase family protein [Coriobacteriia bacterium]|nr:nitroreductase family protein [Coriobacteriia bacterium]
MNELSNPTLEVLNQRASTRSFIPAPLTAEEKDAIVNAAFRAPNACNLMSYSLIEVDDQAIKDRLVHTCDNQPMIAKAPYVLLFVADYQKWVDLFRHSNAQELDAEWREPSVGNLMFCFADALIAAQNAAIAAESLGIGSCYIGDVLENGEEHARLFKLPRYTMPAALLIFGRPKVEVSPRPRQTSYVLQKNSYHQLSDAELQDKADLLGATFAPHGFKPGIADYPQQEYLQKHSSDFMAEMERSVRWWINRWEHGE